MRTMTCFSDRVVSANKLIIAAAVVYAAGVTFAHAAVSIPQEDQAMSSAYCNDRWTTRGVLNDHMYNYCTDKQHEGYLNFVHQVNEYKYAHFTSELRPRQILWLLSSMGHQV
jgi:hypothetical protein